MRRQLSIALLICLPVLVVFLYLYKSADGVDNQPPFSEMIEGEIQVFVFGAFDDGGLEKFQHLVAEYDQDRAYNFEITPENQHETDVFLFILNEWKDIDYAPFQAEFSTPYSEIRSADAELLSQSILYGFDDRSVLFKFINLSNASFRSEECLAKYFLASLNSKTTQFLSTQCQE